MYYFVNCPRAAIEWARTNKLIPDYADATIIDDLTDAIIENLTPFSEDAIVGSLPIRVVARICEKGAKYYDLFMPAHNITIKDTESMEFYGANLKRFWVYANRGD